MNGDQRSNIHSKMTKHEHFWTYGSVDTQIHCSYSKCPIPPATLFSLHNFHKLFNPPLNAISPLQCNRTGRLAAIFPPPFDQTKYSNITTQLSNKYFLYKPSHFKCYFCCKAKEKIVNGWNSCEKTIVNHYAHWSACLHKQFTLTNFLTTLQQLLANQKHYPFNKDFEILCSIIHIFNEII